MADNTQVNNGTGDSIRGKDRGTTKTQVVGLDVGIGGASEILAVGRADGAVRSAADPHSLLYDTFETVDTTNTWTLGGTVSPTGSGGTVNASAGTAANATSFARSQPSFHPGSNAFLVYASVIQLSATQLTGFTSWWGLGVVGTPTNAVPVTNGTVFEIGTDGLLYGRVYSNGAQTQSIALTRPTDGGLHRYQILYRASRVWFNIDGVEVGSVAFPSPAVSAMPVSMGTVNGGAALGTAATLNLTLVGLADSAGGNVQISDALYPWRQAQVRANGALDVNLVGTANALGTSTQVLSAVAATATTQVVNSTSAVVSDVSAAGNVTAVVITSGTTNASLVFEASIDPSGTSTSWFPIDATRSDGSAVETRATITGATAQAWNIMVPGYRWLRVRLAAATTIGTITGHLVLGPVLYDPSPSVTQNPLAALQGPTATTVFQPGTVSTPVYWTGTAAVTTSTVVVAAPGAGLSIYVTDMEGSNEGGSGTRITYFEGTTAKYARFMAPSGGGFVNNLKTPWKLPANTALNYQSSIATTFHLTVNYYVAP